jgi:rhamnogalacturonyl hydrolase YesR
MSHREASTSAWADFIYMVPPFLAYYGVITNNENIVWEAIHQCELYGDLLGTSDGLWKHTVTVGEHVTGERTKDDPGFWSTSNGWAAMGMTRVVATIRRSQFNERFEDEQEMLIEMIEGIVRGACRREKDEFGLLRKYLDDETSFGEVAGTSLLAAAVFRMALIEPRVFYEQFTRWAVIKMNAVEDCINRRTGVVAPVVNPLDESQRTPLDGVSPEAQAFVILLQAAWRDWSLQTFGTPR